MSATLFADAGQDLTADEGAAIEVDGSFIDTNPGTPGTFDITQLTSDAVADSLVSISGDNVAWNSGGRVLAFDGTTDGLGNPNIIDLSALAGITSTQVTSIDVSGERVAFSVVGTGGGVFVYDFSSASLANLTPSAASLGNVGIDGDMVVWQQSTGSFLSSFSFDLADPLATPQLVASASDPGGAGNTTNPVVADGVIYWIGVGTGGFTDVFGKDLATGNIYNVSNTATQNDQNIGADAGVVAWNTVSTQEVFVFDGRGYDGTGTAPTPLLMAGKVGGLNVRPKVSGSNVVWESFLTSRNRDIYAFNIDTATTTALTSDNDTNTEQFSDLSGNSVVWEVTIGASQDLVVYDLATGTTTPVSTDGIADFKPVVSGGNLAYISGTGSASEINFARGAGSATYQVDWDFGDGTVITNTSLTQSHTYLDNGSYTVTLTVTSSTGEIATDTATITVNNLAPQVTALSLDSASVDESGSVTLTGSFADAGVLDTHSVSVTWGDGSTSIATVDQLAGTFTALHTYLDDQPTGTASDLALISVTLTDNDNDSGLANDSVTVNNLAPVVGVITGPTQAVRGQTLSYTGSFTDAGVLDTHTQAWTVTDSSSSVIATGSGSSFNFAPTTLGNFNVTYTVTDDDTGSADNTITLSTSVIVVSADPINPALTTVIVGGGDNAEAFKVTGNSAGLNIDVFDFVTHQHTEQSGIDADRIIIYANGGDDWIKIYNSAGTTPTEIFGGDGHDWIRGGKAHDVIVGGNGIDLISGDGGRDLIIGGSDSDLIVGDSEDDILIAGDYAGQNDLASLRAIMSLWLSSNSYTSRVASLSPVLNASTVSDDGSFDLLLGLQGQDYFMFNDQQDLTDQRRNELMTDTQIDFLDNEDLV